MNPLFVSAIFSLFSYKKELKIIIATFICILFLPVIAVLVASNVGIQVVSDKLASINIKGNTISIHDPTGKIIAQIQAQTTWPVSGVVTLEFGESDLPYQPLHTGIDIADKIGDPVTAFMKGKVIDTESLSWGYGNYVVVDNGNNITSLYGHLSKIEVNKGQTVQPGDIIGLEGQTGWATGSHVHFETRVFGIPVNPRTFVSGNP